MMRTEPLVVGVDVGGSKVLAGEVDERGQVRRSAQLITPGRRVGAHLVENTLLAAVAEVAEGREVHAIGVAAAGLVSADRDRVLFAPHLPWRGEALTARLGTRLGARVVMDNDANCAAIAEATYGAATEANSALMVTLGTGIGGAVLVDSGLWRGANGMAGEFGHMQVVPGGLRCECGGVGCWEQYCSGNALVRDARSRLGHAPSLLEDLCGGVPEELTGPMITHAAAAGDPTARESLAAIGHWLGVGLANLVAAVDPGLLVVGGGVSVAGDALFEPARHALRGSLLAASERTLAGEPVRTIPDLIPATLGPQAGLVGAAVLARGV